MTAKDRLLEFLDYIKIGQNKFEANIGIANGYINNNKGSIGTKIIEKILDVYPELSIEWLITGKGDMIKSQIHGGDIKNLKGNFSGNIMNTGGKFINIPNFGGEKIIKENGEVELQNSAQSWEVEKSILQQRIAALENMVNMKDDIISTLKENISLLKKLTQST